MNSFTCSSKYPPSNSPEPPSNHPECTALHHATEILTDKHQSNGLQKYLLLWITEMYIWCTSPSENEERWAALEGQLWQNLIICFCKWRGVCLDSLLRNFCVSVTAENQMCGCEHTHHLSLISLFLCGVYRYTHLPAPWRLMNLLTDMTNLKHLGDNTLQRVCVCTLCSSVCAYAVGSELSDGEMRVGNVCYWE